MNVTDKQLDDFMDEFKVKLRVLVGDMVKEQHANLWAEHQKLQYRLADVEKQLKELKDGIIWEK
jgi:hemerythrin-like domain-containing protein